MLTVIVSLVSLAAGGYVGMRYGRALEQKAVAAAVSDMSAVDANTRTVLNRFTTRLGYLKKAL